MTPVEFHASRHFVDTDFGRIAYVEQGSGPVALFLHGVPLNGFHWRHVMAQCRHVRRCIALDLMGLGYSEVAATQDLSFAAQAAMVAAVLDALGIERVDVVANDSGGAVAQIFAANNPGRIRSLTLTNCDVHDGWPPEATAPFIAAARASQLADQFASLRTDVEAARSPAGLGTVYARPELLDAPTLETYLAPIVSSDVRREQFNRYWTSFDATQTMAVEAGLRRLAAPALIVWGLADPFFDLKWAYWLRGTLPCARPVVEVPDAKLFFPEDMPEALLTPLLAMWHDIDDA